MQRPPASREVRLVRTVVITVIALALVSAVSGYLLHGHGQSASARSAAPSSGSAANTHSAAPVGTAGTPKSTASADNSASGKATATRSAHASKSSKSASSKPVAVPSKGTGKFAAVRVPEQTNVKTGRTVTYRLNVEGGMHVDTRALSRALGAALLDRRGWQHVDHVRFVQVTPSQLAEGKKAQMTISVASPHQVDRLCAPLPTHGGTSCATGQHVVINYKLWMRGVTYFKGDVAAYREYMVNHEVGHALGHGHQQCTKRGAYAPVMLQQTLGLHGCKPWPWPKRPDSHGKA
ncbi:DUF3152 domain-containing protein [Flexivirga sp. B27]